MQIRIFIIILISIIFQCVPGGLTKEGGYANHALIIPSATMTRGASYKIVCYDETEALRRKKAEIKNKEKSSTENPETKKTEKKLTPESKTEKEKSDSSKKDPSKRSSKKSGQVLGPPVKYIIPEKYRGGCEEESQHSVFYLFNLIPVTPPLNPEYAISTAVQRLEGDTMINIRAWHETHYYSLLGRVSVFKIRGDVIRFSLPQNSKVKKKKRKENQKRGGEEKGEKHQILSASFTYRVIAFFTLPDG